MKSYQERIKGIQISDNDDIVEVKLKKFSAASLLSELKEKRQNQLMIMSEQTRQLEILDQHKIVQIWDNMIIEASLYTELIDIRIKELKKIAA
jgi:hypothetical protein